MQVRPVRTRRDQREFISVPFRTLADSRRWVPPLNSAVRSFMSPRQNPYFREADIDHFIAVEDGRTVGRISTTIEPRFVAERERVGWFGWFDSVDDPAVARALLGRAEEWVAERGMPKLSGPFSYCATQEFGLLVDGFDTTPAAFQPHNEPYYRDLITGAGYAEGFRTHTYAWRRGQDDDVLQRISDRGRRERKRHGLTVRPLNMRSWDREMDLLYDLFIRTFSNNHDMIPMSREVFVWQAEQLKSFLDPALIRIVEHQGDPVAFSLLMADANEVLAATHGKMSPRFLMNYRRLKRNIAGAIVLMIGVRPGLEGLGAGRVLAGEIADVALGRVGRYNTVHTTWIHEENAPSLALVNRTDARPVRTYAVYEKALAR